MLWMYLGEDVFGVVVVMYIVDFVLWVCVGLEVLGVGKEYLGWVIGLIFWDYNIDLFVVVFNGFLLVVVWMWVLDLVIFELVWLCGVV